MKDSRPATETYGRDFLQQQCMSSYMPTHEPTRQGGKGLSMSPCHKKGHPKQTSACPCTCACTIASKHEWELDRRAWTLYLAPTPPPCPSCREKHPALWELTITAMKAATCQVQTHSRGATPFPIAPESVPRKAQAARSLFFSAKRLLPNPVFHPRPAPVLSTLTDPLSPRIW